MLCIYCDTDDIFFNLASEEYFLKNKTDDLIMLWQSKSAVVVGKHQNVLAEINYPYVRKKKIVVARRLSGGGTVYLDSGSLNFTFIINGEKGKLVNFNRFTTPIVEFLKIKGVPATIGIRNDILVNGLKVSGNAEHVLKTRLLHHGTILFNTDLNTLRKSLQVLHGKYFDRAVRSNPSNVTNLSEHMKNRLSMKKFSKELYRFLFNKYTSSILYSISEQEIHEIQKLRDEKYACWDWIYGYSPAFEVERSFVLTGKKYTLNLKVFKGIIVEAHIQGTNQNEKMNYIVERLLRCRYEFYEVKHALDSMGFDSKTTSDLLNILF
jgi:lipoate-protein ligase A